MLQIRRINVAAFVAALFLAGVNADARQITLAWDANVEPSVAGYIVFYGTEPGKYTDSKDVGNLISWQFDLPGPQYYFAVREYDTNGNVSEFSLEVGDTPAVSLTTPGDQFSAAGDVVTLPLVATGPSVAYGAIGLPPGLGIDPATGRISGVLGSTAFTFSTYVVTAQVSDPSGNVSSVQFIWTLRTNHAPVITNPGSQSAIAGRPLTRTVAMWDIDGDPLTYSALGLPTGLDINPATGVISGTVASDAIGVYDVTVGASDGALGTQVTFIWTVSAPGALAVDRVVSADAFGSIVNTPAFSTSVPSETLIAFVTAAQPTETGVQTAFVTGGGLSWTLVTRANTQAGTAEIWQATSSDLLSDVTVSATVEIDGDPLTLTVVTFAGSAGVGASAAASDVTGAPLVSLTTTTAGSFVYGAGNDWDSAIARTPALNQVIVHESVTDTADTYWVQNYVGPVAVAGTIVSLLDTDPTNDRWNFAAVEIVPQVLAPTVTVSPTLAVAGTTITATVVHGPGNTTDWVGLFRVDADNSTFQEWEYLNGSQTPPASGLTSATLHFVAPTTPGLYNLRLFVAGNSTTPVATSSSVLIPSSLTINNVSIAEGNSGTTHAVFTVTMTPASPVSVTVDYATADGTATAGSDYVAATGVVTFPPGTRSQTIGVSVLGDTVVEPNETFVVNLSNAMNAVIVNGQGHGTMTNDDVATLTINDVAVAEGNSGTTNAVFTVTLTPASPATVTIKYATANGSATAGSDYIATNGTLTFPAGTTTRTITVAIVGDTVVEPDETFVINLSGATNATIADAQGVGTIANDDTAAALEGRMFGFGTIDEGHTRNRFLFRVSERNTRDFGRLEFWSTDDRNDDDDNDRECNGDRDGDYGRNHHNVRLRFESTAIGLVTFSDDPAFTPGSGRRQPTVDTVVFAGAGKWNGKSGYTFEARATDQGEPGRNRDTFSLVVKDSRGTIVASVSGKIDSGNIQSTRLAR